MAQEHDSGKIDPFHHVLDSKNFETFQHWEFPVPLGLSKFEFLQLVACALVLLLILPLAFWVRDGAVPNGNRIKRIWWNLSESLLVFVRDQIAKPALGEDYKPYLPLLWTMFLYILLCNLLGMLPFLGSPTGSLMVTGVLALISFCVIHASGIVVNGGGGYLKSFIPHMELGESPAMLVLGKVITVGMFFLELLGAVLRSLVLAIRLFANMLAGHTVLFVILSFIFMVGTAKSAAAEYLFWPVTLVSVALVTLLSVLELFIACLQAYVFTFLTATFIGLARHPHH